MIKNISEKTLQDLEFTTVLQHVAEFCITDLGKNKIKRTKPYTNNNALFKELNLVNEYLSSFESENRIPNHVLIISLKILIGLP
ncbi:hypothetical protein [Lutibacter sp. Hel_I_33_5]|uniref:hypothetical protein n=1 Tax=Lutibacter sp. Hel_I_33_5 TaxID=1566289 RepID=UPI002103850F|nr:hypothetical protein [Lutibacter sp. Hel_I_33_5]